jgi:hypothetical protein
VSEPEAFLTRWARRKRDAAKAVTAVAANPDASDGPSPEDAIERLRSGGLADREGPESGERAPSPSVFDSSLLPALDSISAATDVRPFLAPDVPAELTRAALRRAWTTDPAIRDFVGLADYDWDFNTPGAIPGFHPLEMTEELRRRMTDMVGRSLSETASDHSSASPHDHEGVTGAPENSGDFNVSMTVAAPSSLRSSADAGQESAGSSRGREEFAALISDYTAVQHLPPSSVEKAEVLPRRHGGALPK